MTTLRLIDADIERALARLPEAPAGTPDAREAAVIREHLLIAKARLATMQRRPDPAGSTEWGR